MSQVISDFPVNAGFANGLFVMTPATDHKNNLNRSTLKKTFARTLRVETSPNSASCSDGRPTKYGISQCEIQSRWIPNRRDRELPGTHHSRTHTPSRFKSLEAPSKALKAPLMVSAFKPSSAFQALQALQAALGVLVAQLVWRHSYR